MKELAAVFGIHRTIVSPHLTEQGVPIRRGGLHQEQTAEVVQLYEDGWSSGRLGERFGVGADTGTDSPTPGRSLDQTTARRATQPEAIAPGAGT